MRAPWLVRVLYAPDVELDLCNDQGRVQHGKVVGFVFVLLVFAGELIGIHLSLGKLIVLASAIFGSKMFYDFLQSRVVSANESATVNEAIVRRRDAEAGVEPSP